MVMVIPPHVMHKTEGGAFERFNINVDSTYLDPFQRETLELISLKALTPSEKQFSLLLELLEKAETITASRHRDSILKAIFSYVILLLSELEINGTKSAAASDNTLPPLVLKTIDHINSNYSEHLTLDTLAQAFFVSKGTLIYNFKKYAGCSPMDYLLSVRLSHAKLLLTETRDGIDGISKACGFASANYFGLIFKKKTGLSPTAYRRHENQKH
jgi:AraC-like DNA-binding protein